MRVNGLEGRWCRDPRAGASPSGAVLDPPRGAARGSPHARRGLLASPPRSGYRRVVAAVAVSSAVQPNAAAAAPQPAAFHIPSLDGLRAVSFLIVFAAHAGLDRVVPGGFGVTVFFFLSGYLITTLMRIEAERTARVSKEFLSPPGTSHPAALLHRALGRRRLLWRDRFPAG